MDISRLLLKLIAVYLISFLRVSKNVSAERLIFPTVPRSVSLYYKYLISEVQKCEELSCLFNVGNVISREELASGIFNFVTATEANANIPEAAHNAYLSSRYITSSHTKLSSEQFVSVYAKASGKYSYVSGVLNCRNAKQLAGTYAESTKYAARKVVNEDFPRSKVLAVCAGYSEYLDRLNIHDNVEVISRTIGNEWLYQRNSNYSFKVPDVKCSNCNSTILNLKPSKSFCKHRSKAVDRFLQALRKCIEASETLTDLFNACQTPKPDEISRGLSYVAVYLLDILGSSNPAYLGDYASKFAKNVKSLTPSQVVDVHAKFMAKYLESVKILNFKNARDLAEKYAKAFEMSANLIVDQKHPNSKTSVLLFGSRELLLQLNAFKVDNALQLAYFYGNEWSCLNKQS